MTEQADRGYALVTGASKGLGAEMAEQLAAAKWNLILVARSKTELDALAKAITEKHGVTARVVPADLSKAGSAVELWNDVQALGVPVEVLINNAGFGLLGAFRETDIARELEMIQVNVTTLVHLTKLALPAMLERKRGYVMNVASTAGFVPGPFMSIYYASKAFVLSWSEALHAELQGTGVLVSALCPGATKTQFADTAKSNDSKLFKGGNVMEAGPVVKAGLAGMFKGTAVVIPGVQNKLLIQGLRVAPRSLLRGISKSLQQPG